MPAAILVAAAAAATAAAVVPDTIIVTGQPLPRAASAAPFAAITLDSAALETASRRPEDALRAVGGVQLFRRASGRTANPTAEGLTARGLTGNAASRMAVTLDGIPQADPFFGSISWTALATRPITFARLERGGGDPAAGPGGVAGTIALETGLAPGRVSAAAGRRESLDLGVLADVPLAAGALSVAVRHQRGRGHLLVDDAVAGPADRPARYRQSGVNLRAVVPAGEDTELQAVLAMFLDDRLRGADGADIRATGGDAGLRLVHEGAWALEAAAWAQLRDFATTIVGFSSDRSSAAPTLDQRATPSAGGGARIEVRPPAFGNASLRLGADIRRADGETRERFRFIAGNATRERRAGGSQTGAGAFAEAGISGRTVQATLAGRIDGWWLGNGRTREIDLGSGLPTLVAQAADRSGAAWSGRAGLGWRATPAIALSVQASRAIRVPTLNELHRPFRIGTIFTDANQALEPERATSIAATVRYEPLPTARLSLSMFQTHLSDAIANVTLGQGPGSFPSVGFLPAGGQYRQRRNLPAIHSRGIEADAALAIGRWSLAGSLALVDPRVRGGTVAPDLSGLRPAQAARFSASASVGRDFGPARVRADLRHVGAQYEDDRNRIRLAPATTIDLMLAALLGHGLTLEASAENLFDAPIETGFSGQELERGQPFTLWLGLGWSPG